MCIILFTYRKVTFLYSDTWNQVNPVPPSHYENQETHCLTTFELLHLSLHEISELMFMAKYKRPLQSWNRVWPEAGKSLVLWV